MLAIFVSLLSFHIVQENSVLQAMIAGRCLRYRSHIRSRGIYPLAYRTFSKEGISNHQHIISQPPVIDRKHIHPTPMETSSLQRIY